MEDKYKFALNYYPHIFPHLPTSEMAIAFAPPFPWWFIYGEFLKIHKNEFLKHEQRVTPAKLDLYSFKFHLHVDIDHVRVETPIHEGEEGKEISSTSFKSYNLHSLCLQLLLFYHICQT